MDRTRWCAYCQWTVEPDSLIRRCDPCRIYRDNNRRKPVGHAFTSLPTEVLDALLGTAQAAAHVMARIDGRLALNQDPLVHEMHDLSRVIADLHGITLLANEYLGR